MSEAPPRPADETQLDAAHQIAIPGPLSESLGRYRILKRLGTGGMGSVHLARDPDLDRTVAIKIPHLDPADHRAKERIGRFLREAKAAARIRHPNVCPIHDVGVQDGVPYAVLEYVEGRSLQEVLDSEGPVADPGRAADIARQLAEALAAVHEHAIIHRDVKPSNVLLDSEGKPLLVDFGLARFEARGDRLTAEGSVLGTPAYMSPEQAAGDQSRIDARSDVYGLGAVLFHLLAGRAPYEGSVLEVIRKIHEGPPDPLAMVLPGLDAALASIVDRALARRPEDRYRSAREMAGALAGWLERRPAGPAARARRTLGLGPILGAALLLVALAAAVLYLRPRGSDPMLPAPPAPATEAFSLGPGTLLADAPGLEGVEDWTIETTRARGALRAAAFSPDGEILAVAGDDGTIRLLDPAGRRLVACLVEGRAISALVWTRGGRIVTGGPDGVLRVWDVQKGAILAEAAGDAAGVGDLALSPDGSSLASCGPGSVAVRPLVGGAFDHPEWEIAEGASSVAWLGEDRLVVAHRSGTRVLEARTGLEVSRLPEEATAIAVSPTGAIATAGPSGRIASRRDGVEEGFAAPDGLAVFALAWSPGGRALASGGAFGSVFVWTRGEDRPVEVAEHHAAVLDLAWSPDGSWLASVAEDGMAQIRRVSDRGVVGVFRGLPRRLFAAATWRGEGLVAASFDGTISFRPALEDGQATCRGYQTRILAVAPTPDGMRLAVAHVDRRLVVWSFDGQRRFIATGDPDAATTALAWSPDGKLLASGTEAGTAFVEELDPVRGRALPAGSREPVRALSWSPRGEALAVGFEGGRIEVFDARSLERTGSSDLGEGPLLGLSWRGERDLLAAVARPDGSLRLRDAWGAAGPRELRGHASRVGWVWFSAGGAVLASVDASGLARVWDVASGTVRSSAFALPDGSLAAVRSDGSLEGPNVEEAGLVHVLVSDRVFRTLAPPEFEAAFPRRR